MNWWEEAPLADDQERWWESAPLAEGGQEPGPQQAQVHATGTLPSGAFREPKERSAGRAAREGVGFLAENVFRPGLEGVQRANERVGGFDNFLDVAKNAYDGAIEPMRDATTRPLANAIAQRTTQPLMDSVGGDLFTREGGWGGDPSEHPIYGRAREQRQEALGDVQRVGNNLWRWGTGQAQWEGVRDFFSPPPRSRPQAVEQFVEMASQGKRPPIESVNEAAAWARSNPEMVDDRGLAEIIYWREFYKRRSNQ